MTHETIRLRVEKTLPSLEHLKSLEVLSHGEVVDVLEARTNFEYKLCCPRPLQRDFIECIDYEKALRARVCARAAELGATIHQKWMREVNGRVFLVFERYLRRFGERDRAQRAAILSAYAEYLTKLRQTDRLHRVLTRSLEADPTNETLWRMLVRHGGRQITDVDRWRGLLTRAARMCPRCAELHHQRVALEVRHVAKGIRLLQTVADRAEQNRGIAQLAPLEEVPQCVFAAFLASLQPAQIRAEWEALLGPFLDACAVPFGRGMMESLCATLAVFCGGSAVEGPAAVDCQRLADVQPVDEAHGAILEKMRQSLEARIARWEDSNGVAMQNIENAVRRGETVAAPSDDLEVVTEDLVEARASPLTDAWKALASALQTASKHSVDAASRGHIVELFAQFASEFARKIPNAETLSEMQFVEKIDSFAESAQFSDLTSEILSEGDIAPAALDCFIGALHALPVPVVSAATRLLAFLRARCGLLQHPANLHCLASGIAASAFGEAVETLSFASPESGNATLSFITAAWKSLEECPLAADTNLRLRATHWRVLQALADAPPAGITLLQKAEKQSERSSPGMPSESEEDEAEDSPKRSQSSAEAVEAMLHGAMRRALETKTVADRAQPAVSRVVAAEASACAAFCFGQLLRLGWTTQGLTARYSAHSGLFGPAAWRALAQHPSSHAPTRLWAHERWLESARASTREALLEAYAAWLEPGNGLPRREVERVRSAAFAALRPEEARSLYRQ